MKKLLILFIFFFRYTSYSQTAEQFYDSGLEKLQNGVYEDAISDFNKATIGKEMPLRNIIFKDQVVKVYV